MRADISRFQASRTKDRLAAALLSAGIQAGTGPGDLRWGLDLVRQYGATIPPWYAGQCPLVDKGAVILAPGGNSALLLACDSQTGAAIWQTPNPRGWKMTHSSVMPMEFGGQKFYVYCGSGGVASEGVERGDGPAL